MAAVLLLGAIAATAPLAWRAGSGLPIGHEGVATVPQFNLWSLSWTASRIPHGLTGWWDAPIFWPHTGTYANSELQPLTGLAFWLLRGLTGATGAYGSVLIGAVALNGWAMYRLALRLGSSIVPALAAGLLAESLPFAMTQIGVLQLLMLWPIVLALERFLAWAHRPTIANAIGIGVALSASFLTCGYHAALFVAVGMPSAFLLVGRPVRIDRARVGQLMMAGAVVVVCCLPFALGQQARLDGIRWTRATITDGSTTWDSLAPGGRHWVSWPLAVLGTAGALVGWRRREVRFLVAVAVGGALVALGLRLSILGWRPYEFLVGHVEVFARLRSPFRATAVVQIALTALSAITLDRAWQRRRAAGAVLAAGGLAVAAAVGPIGAGPIVAGPDIDSVWIDWLAEHPGGAVVVLPMAPGRRVEEFEPTTRAMLQSLEHGHPLVNGYSGFFPTGQAELRETLGRFPDTDSLDTMQALGVRYVVADAAWWTSRRDEDARGLGLTVVLAGPSGVLLQLDR